jgi:hypothetical protein
VNTLRDLSRGPAGYILESIERVYDAVPYITAVVGTIAVTQNVETSAVVIFEETYLGVSGGVTAEVV